MICKNCGNEFEEGTKFCSECGTKVDIEENNSVEIKNEETVEEKENSSQVQDAISVNDNSDKKSFIKEIMADEKKKKIFIVGVIAIIVIFIVIIIAASKSGSNNNYYGNNDSYNSGYNDDNDDFGNNEVVTQPQTTEVPTVATVDNIEVVYDDVIYYQNHNNAIKINNYQIVPNSLGGYNVYFNFEKMKGDNINFAADIYLYDSNGTIINDNQLYAYPFGNDEIGKKYKDDFWIFPEIADSVVRIEIVGD